MMKFALLTLAAAALFATASAASAQYYGPGFGVQIEPRYERDYDERRYFRRNARECPPNYTVQDGVCKPYRGY